MIEICSLLTFFRLSETDFEVSELHLTGKNHHQIIQLANTSDIDVVTPCKPRIVMNTQSTRLVSLLPILLKLDELIAATNQEPITSTKHDLISTTNQEPISRSVCISAIQEPSFKSGSIANNQEQIAKSGCVPKSTSVQVSSLPILQTDQPLQPSHLPSLLDTVNWLSESDLDDLGFPEPISLPEPMLLPKTISFTVVPKSPNSNLFPAHTAIKRSNTTGTFLLSDPISQSSSSPVKLPLFDYVPQAEPQPKRRNTRKLKPSTTITDENGFLYTTKQLKEANRVTRKKEELLSEMCLHFPRHLYDNYFNDDDVKSVMEHIAIEHYESEYPIIYWTRRLTSRYDKINDIFIPCHPTEVMEKTILIYFKAENLIHKLYDKTLSTEIENCLKYMKKREETLDYHVIVIIEGYDQYLRKLKNIENNKFREDVLKRLNFDKRGKKRKHCSSSIQLSPKEVQDLINDLQVELGVNFFPIKSNQEVIEWMYSFSFTIANSLYDKWERNQSLSNLGKVKTGTDAKSTYLNSLQQFKSMSAPKAERLYGFHSTMYSIYESFRKSGCLGNDEHGRSLVPPLLEESLRRTFMSDDPNEVVRK